MELQAEEPEKKVCQSDGGPFRNPDAGHAAARHFSDGHLEELVEQLEGFAVPSGLRALRREFITGLALGSILGTIGFLCIGLTPAWV